MLIIQGGMYRSGTTYQFNVVRVIMEMIHGKENVYSEWVDFYQPKGYSVEIVKTHKPKPKLLRNAKFVLSTNRTEEGIKGSMNRRKEFSQKNPDIRFSNEANVDRYDEFMEWAKYWMKNADYIQDFDMIKQDPQKLIQDYINLFGYQNLITAKQVKKRMDQIKPPKEGYDPETLLHVGHITKK